MAEPLYALLIEEDQRLAKFTAEYLREHDVAVTHLYDGESAIGAIARGRFGVVVLDIMLPKASGLDVCHTAPAT